MHLSLPSTKLLLAGALCLSSLVASAQQYAASVVAVTQGTANNPTGIPAPGRSITANALGMPQNSDATTTDAAFNAYSLGFGGSITLKFNQPFTRGAGADLQLFETSFGNRVCNTYPERVLVYLSQTGEEGSFILADSGCLNFDMEMPASLAWAQYVKVVDKSTPSYSAFANIGDGYDLDGITAPYLYTLPPGPPNCETGVLNKVVSFTGGKRKDYCTVTPSRQVASNALGMPNGEVCGPINFVSLGYGGTAVYEFAYTQFDRPGADLAVYETSWGDCWWLLDIFFPEQAEFWGSNDGTTWTLLKSLDNTCAPGRIIRDGKLDICTMPLVGGYRTLRFIKVIDKTDRCNIFFPGYSDGYDLDAIVSTSCFKNCRMPEQEPYEPSSESGAFAQIGNTVDVAPNPAASSELVQVRMTLDQDMAVSVDLFDLSGKLVQHLDGGLKVAGPHVVELSTGSLKPGVYMVRMAGDKAEMTQSVRLVIK